MKRGMRRLVSIQIAVLALGLASAAAESRGLSDFANCGIILGTSVAQLRAAEPSAVWEQREDPALKQTVPVAILGRARGDRPADAKHSIQIYFAGQADAGAAYRISCRKNFVDSEIDRGVDEIRSIAFRFGPPVESYSAGRPIPFAAPARAGAAFPVEYYWGGTRAEFRANARKPMLLVQVWKDGMDRDVLDIRFDLADGGLRP